MGRPGLAGRTSRGGVTASPLGARPCPSTPPTAPSSARSTAATRCARCSTSAPISSACWTSRRRWPGCRRGSASSRPMPPQAITARRARREPRHRGTCRQCAQCRLPGGRPGRRTVARRGRGRRLDALGRHDAGHHGHRHRAAGARRAGADPRRARRHGRARWPRRRTAPPHRDGRAHPSATGAADHLRAEMRDLGAAADRPRPAPGRAAPAGRAGAVRRRGRHAGLARRPGHRGDGGAGRRTRPRRAGRALARQPRRLRRNGRVSGPGLRQPGEIRHRHDPAGADRGGRSGRTLRRRPRLIVHHAAEAQPDRQRIHPGRGANRACAGAGDAGRDGGRPRARHRTLAGRAARPAAGVRADPRRAAARRAPSPRAWWSTPTGCGATSI